MRLTKLGHACVHLEKDGSVLVIDHGPPHGDTFTAAGFDVHVYGSGHAVLHQDIPMIANVGFMVDGDVFHPGDALSVPEDPVGTLLLPSSAPWMKLAEMIDYARAVDARRGYTIHDALFSQTGLSVLGAFLGMATGPSGGSFAQREVGSSVDL